MDKNNFAPNIFHSVIESIIDRPQCKKCGKRVKRKEPVKRDDVSKKWSKK